MMKIKKRRQEHIWKIIDEVEFQLGSIKDSLKRDSEMVILDLEEQRKALLNATRLAKRS